MARIVDFAMKYGIRCCGENKGKQVEGQKPVRDLGSYKHFIVFGRDSCTLCDEVVAVLEALGLSYEMKSEQYWYRGEGHEDMVSLGVEIIPTVVGVKKNGMPVDKWEGDAGLGFVIVMLSSLL